MAHFKGDAVTKFVVFMNAQRQLQGVTEADDRKFRAMRRKFRDMEPGSDETAVIVFDDPRCPKHHGKFLRKLRELFKRTEAFKNETELRQWLTMKANHVEWVPGPDSTPNAIAKSMDFETLEEAEFAELHRAVDEVLWSTEGLAKLWPHLPLEKQYEAMQDFMRAYE